MSASSHSTQHESLLSQAITQYPKYASFPAAIVNIRAQILYIYVNTECVAEYPVSTSRFGVGQQIDSFKTPLGVHCVKEKIGENAEFAEIFESRKRSHEIANIEVGPDSTDKECITSRIIWLSGLEEDFNLGGDVDSYQRYIYIHGTHEEGLIGQPASQGCIRMKNQDVIDLFDQLEVNSLVIISI